jgi:hypothetical protein
MTRLLPALLVLAIASGALVAGVAHLYGQPGPSFTSFGVVGNDRGGVAVTVDSHEPGRRSYHVRVLSRRRTVRDRSISLGPEGRARLTFPSLPQRELIDAELDVAGTHAYRALRFAVRGDQP